MDFLANNWFSIFTVVCLIGSGCFHYGVSKQRNTQTAKAVDELKAAMMAESHKLETHIEHKVEAISSAVKANADAIQRHTGNADIHVSSLLMELFKTRHDFVVQQMADTRNDISRIEQQLVKV